MLAFTLSPAPDETLHSIVARHGMLLGRLDAADLTATIFGRAATVLCADHPCGLDYASGMLGFPDGRTLLDAHTAHPYATAFATEVHRTAAEAWALRAEGRHRGDVGVMSGMIRPRPVLAFCDDCIGADGGHGVVHAWKRAHQLPGAFVCHLHGNPLRHSTIERAGRRGKHAFAALTDVTVRGAQAAARLSARDSRVFYRYAQASARLLQPGKQRSLGAFQARLRELLTAFRWERAGSLIAMSKLVPALVGHPNVAPLLRAMGADWSDSTWATALNGLLYRERSSKHPLVVLMLLETVGATVDDLLEPQCSEEREYLVCAPPLRSAIVDVCANVACARSQPEAVEAFARGPAGLRATCSACGFAVRASKHVGFRPIVLHTCASWEAAVAKVLADSRTSVREASRRFGASPCAIMRAGRRAGAWRSEWKDRPKLTDRAGERTQKLCERHRAAWLTHTASAAAGTPTKLLPRPAFNAYRWLLSNDRAWLAANDGPGPGRWADITHKSDRIDGVPRSSVSVAAVKKRF